jgi:hypothetical protein
MELSLSERESYRPKRVFTCETVGEFNLKRWEDILLQDVLCEAYSVYLQYKREKTIRYRTQYLEQYNAIVTIYNRRRGKQILNYIE